MKSPSLVSGLWLLSAVCVAVVLLGAPSRVCSQDFEIILKEASAEVDLSFSDGFSFMGSGSDEDEILNPTVDFAAYASATASPLTSIFGRGAAYQDQFGINAVFIDTERGLDDAQNYVASADTNYRVTIRDRATTGGGTIPFTFVINSGEVRLENFSALDTFPFFEALPVVSVLAEIVIDGEIWRFTTGLSTDQNGDVVEVGDVLGNRDGFGLGNFPNLSLVVDGDDAFISVPRIEGTVDIPLSDFRGPGGVEFQYNMRTDVSISSSFGVRAVGGITDPFALGTVDPADDVGGAYSPLGVQFFLDGQPLGDYPIRIPEPATAMLAALLLLAAYGLPRHSAA